MSVLDRILETKRAEVAARQCTISLSDLERRIGEAERPRGFRAALDRAAGDGYALIAEVKRASPSKGVIRADFDPPAHARAYEAGGAACLSVLTDEQWFRGADEFLIAARDAVAIPVLRKDFTVDPWQATEARSLGADAILLIMAAVDDQAAGEIEAAALECGLDVLVEVHDRDELDRAMKLRSRLIGVNNRDLRDFTVSFERTFELVAHAPAGCTFVAESGLSTRDDLDRMAERGVRCFLVGEALMRADDIEAATRTLLGR
jgi:indole-3-glycerol phosphate synthase